MYNIFGVQTCPTLIVERLHGVEIFCDSRSIRSLALYSHTACYRIPVKVVLFVLLLPSTHFSCNPHNIVHVEIVFPCNCVSVFELYSSFPTFLL